ncbi:MAG: alpha-galactosidase [Frondihabitans sp.]|nr:alpha-galactosidase [Frondihabitans sp.]
MGLPEWSADWTSLGLRHDGAEHVALWSRTDGAAAIDLSLPHLVGHDITVTTEFPSHLEQWPTRWDPSTGTLHVTKPTHEVGARLYRISPLS